MLPIDPLIVSRIVGLVRTIQTHGLENDAARTAALTLTHEINRLVEGHRFGFSLQLVDRVLVVNGSTIRHRDLPAEQIEVLRQILEARDFGGFAVERPVEPKVMLEWFSVVARNPRDPAAVSRIRADLSRFSSHGIRTLDRRTIQDLEMLERIDVTTFAYALQTYARAIVGFSEVVRNLRCGDEPFSGRINVIRVVQDLIGIVERRPDHLVRITTRQREQPMEQAYANVHAANTCVYALLMGRVLGLDRLELLDLGAAALLADVGFAILPEELTENRGAISPADRQELKNFMIRAVQAMFGRGKLEDSMIRRVICAYEHHRPYALPGREPSQIHVYSRLVAVADAYDALTTSRTWRPALEPIDALSHLRGEAGTRFDPHMVAALAVVARAA